MKVKRIGNKVQATLEPAEVLRLDAINTVDPNNPIQYRTIGDAIRGAVWRLLTLHALKELDGLKFGWGMVTEINGSIIVTYGPEDEAAINIPIPMRME